MTGRGQALVPSWLAFAVTRLLEENFDWLVDYDFTAEMEEDLDAIAAGDKDRVAWLSRFYFGDGSGNEEGEGLRDLVANLGDIDAREVNSIPIGEGIVLRVGRYGPYLEDSAAEPAEDGTTRRASVPEELAPDELTVAKARELLETQPEGDQVLGTDPVDRHADRRAQRPLRPVRHRDPARPGDRHVPVGRRRRSARWPPPRSRGPRRCSSRCRCSRSPSTTRSCCCRCRAWSASTRSRATEITAQNGRYGPYLKKGTDSRTLASEEALFTTTLDEALAIYAQPKRGRGATAAPPLRELGDDPTSEKPIDGQGGPLRRLRHRRRHQPDPPARPHARDDHARAGDRAARREARVGPREEEGTRPARAGEAQGRREEVAGRTAPVRRPAEQPLGGRAAALRGRPSSAATIARSSQRKCDSRIAASPSISLRARAGRRCSVEHRVDALQDARDHVVVPGEPVEGVPQLRVLRRQRGERGPVLTGVVPTDRAAERHAVGPQLGGQLGRLVEPVEEPVELVAQPVVHLHQLLPPRGETVGDGGTPPPNSLDAAASTPPARSPRDRHSATRSSVATADLVANCRLVRADDGRTGRTGRRRALGCRSWLIALKTPAPHRRSAGASSAPATSPRRSRRP